MVGKFKEYVDSLHIPIRPVPPRRHSKNSIESKHNIIRSIYLRLMHEAGANQNSRLTAYKAVSISNDLYGNDTMSAFEMEKGFTKPLDNNPERNVIPDDVLEAHDALQARRKLLLILKSKAVKELTVKVGDPLEIYSKQQHEKRGTWSAAKPILSVHKESRSVTVPGKKQQNPSYSN